MSDVRNSFKWLAPVILGLTLAGCAKDSATTGMSDTSAADRAAAEAAAANRVSTAAASTASAYDKQALNQRVVYFGFDSSTVDGRFMRTLEAHAMHLRANPNARVRLEGHGDERGTREYNIGLGERRARAVERMLLLKGAARNQISTVSYGEERPVALGHNEDAWRLNRRVELVYK